MRRVLYYTIEEFLKNWCLVIEGNNSSIIIMVIEAFICSFFGIFWIVSLPISIRIIYQRVKDDLCGIDGNFKKDVPVLSLLRQ